MHTSRRMTLCLLAGAALAGCSQHPDTPAAPATSATAATSPSPSASPVTPPGSLAGRTTTGATVSIDFAHPSTDQLAAELAAYGKANGGHHVVVYSMVVDNTAGTAPVSVTQVQLRSANSMHRGQVVSSGSPSTWVKDAGGVPADLDARGKQLDGAMSQPVPAGTRATRPVAVNWPVVDPAEVVATVDGATVPLA